MANFEISPTPMKTGGGVGKGFWIQLRDDLKIAVQILGDNTAADAGTSGNDSDEDHFDPAENTVTELQTGIDSIIANNY